MRAINLKVWDNKNKETRIRLRFAANQAQQFIKYLKSMDWENDLRTKEELMEEGLWPDRRHTDG